MRILNLYKKGYPKRFAFGPSYELSIINTGYGAPSMLEVGVIKNGELVELPGITESGDTVKGWLTEDSVDGILMKMMLVTGHDPELIE